MFSSTAQIRISAAWCFTCWGKSNSHSRTNRREDNMKTLVALLTLAGTGAFADELAGHYVLYGVHEVGSELLLKPDGTFEYMLAYGAADYSATGKWRREG